MIQVIKETNPVARKDHYCDACTYLLEVGYNGIGLSFHEYRDIVKAKRNGYKIKKGSKYLNQFNTDGGDCWSFKAIYEIHRICVRLDIYDI